MEYRDKMMAGWIGQMVGVGWGAPTEFWYMEEIIPLEDVPAWVPEKANVHEQDDLYVEMTFLRSMELYGLDVSIKQAGIDFANSAYLLWHANKAGRDNLRKGIAPPNSGHPAFSDHSDDIDYQIEADFSGLIAPGLPNMVIALGEKFGRLMNYGDGLYGGQFVGGMYAEAFFEDDPLKLVQAGLSCIPEGSQYAEAVRDVIRWHSEHPDDWEATWGLIQDKYHYNPDYRRHSCSGIADKFNIDAKINGAYIVMGLLYGDRDLDQTTIIAMRCGQDSDCNPSNAAGVMFTTVGYSNLPERFTSGLDLETKFSFTEYNFPQLIDICEILATEAVTRAGGRVEINSEGEEVFVIPVVSAVPGKLEQSWAPGPLSENEFNRAELTQIRGLWILRYSLLLLLLMAFLISEQNRKLRALVILIPLLALGLVLMMAEKWVWPEFQDYVNIIMIFESLVAGIAMLLLLRPLLTSSKWQYSILTMIMIIILSGIVGVFGSSGGRFIASTNTNLATYSWQAIVWILAMITTVLLCRKSYGLLRFNLILLGSSFIFHLCGFYLVTTAVAKLKDWAEVSGDLSIILIGATVLTIVHYLITMPFLLLTYFSADYERRLLAWMGQDR